MTILELPTRQRSSDAPGLGARGASISDQGQIRRGARKNIAVVGSNSPEGHDVDDAQSGVALGGRTLPGDHLSIVAGESDSETGAIHVSTPIWDARPSLFDPSLTTLAALLDDIEGVRKANGNRVRILTADSADKDGVVRGFGLTEDHPAVGILSGLGEQLDAVEHQTILVLQRAMRQHPLRCWQKQAKGVGEKQLARLLAAIGDPYVRTMSDGSEQPRTVSQLWAYCGLHTLPAGQSVADDHRIGAGGEPNSRERTEHTSTPIGLASAPGSHAAARRQKGQKCNWSTDAKTRAYLIATSVIKQTDSEYRAAYLARREHTAQTHPDWTDGHSHNDALRVTSKRILRDLWRAARDYHETDSRRGTRGGAS